MEKTIKVFLRECVFLCKNRKFDRKNNQSLPSRGLIYLYKNTVLCRKREKLRLLLGVKRE